MSDHHTLAAWEHDGATYTVMVRLEDDQPREVIMEQVVDGEVRRTSLAAADTTLDQLQESWSTRKRRNSVMSFRVRQVLDIAGGLHDSDDRQT